MNVYYFGCWGDKGHYLWTPTGDTLRRATRDIATPWTIGEMDATRCRKAASASRGRGSCGRPNGGAYALPEEQRKKQRQRDANAENQR